jgi:PAS domain S-box-containing protein
MPLLPEHDIKTLLLDKISDVVIVTDPKGRALWVNKSFTEQTGYSLKEILGKAPGKILQGEETDPEAVKLMREAVEHGEPFHINIVNYTKSGRKYWMNIDAKPVFDQETQALKYFIAIERDITAEIESQQKMINDYILQLQRAADEKEKLISSISMLSHDLKSPINRILGLLQFIDTGKLSEMERETMSFIKKECERLKKLTEKILLTQKGGEEADVELQWLDVNQLIEELINTFSKDLDQKQLKMEFNPNGQKVEANLDYILLHQVLENLISNSIKYTPEGRKISISIEQEDGQVHIKVKDQGIGISKWKQKHLFSPFQNLTTYQQISSTSGMGLFIVKKYVDLLKGTVHVESKEGKGTTFELIFPKDASEAPGFQQKAA